MKRFRFPKGITRVDIPFTLGFSPWQDQVADEIVKMKERYRTSKSAKYGYLIEDGFAMITITKV